MVDAKAFIVVIPDTHKLEELCLDGSLYVILLVILARISCVLYPTTEKSDCKNHV